MNLSGGNLVVKSGFNLGTASTTAITPTKGQEKAAPVMETLKVENRFELKAFPNPTTSQFKLQVESENRKDKINLRVMDLNGRTVELLWNVIPGQTLQLGAAYRPGMYIVEMVQGTNRKQIKLLKQPD